MEIDEEDYVGSFKPEMMDVVFAWAKGASFSQIIKLTDIFEGRLELKVHDLISQNRVLYLNDAASRKKCWIQIPVTLTKLFWIHEEIMYCTDVSVIVVPYIVEFILYTTPHLLEFGVLSFG